MPPPRDVPFSRAEATAVARAEHDLAAVVVDRHLTVVFANAAASVISPAFAEGANLALAVILDRPPAGICAERAGAIEYVTSALRTSLWRHGEDARFLSLVGELAALSAEFSRAWADDGPVRIVPVHLAVGSVGTIVLTSDPVPVADGSGDVLVRWAAADAESGSRMRKVRALGSE